MGVLQEIDWVAKARNPGRGSPAGAALLAGHAAYHAGAPPANNPFCPKAESDLANHWLRGREIAEQGTRRMADPKRPPRGASSYPAHVAGAMEE